MFYLCVLPLSLFDYRLIAINALIYDLIATEIVNVKAHFVVAAANGMTEFDKSATMQATHNTTTEILRQANEKWSNALEISTTRRSTAPNNNDRAKLAFFGPSESDDSPARDNENLSNRNIGFTLTPSGNSSISFSSTRNSNAAVGVAVAVAIAAARPFAMLMLTDNCSRYANNINVRPAINERVDNLRNDKKQIASTAIAGRNLKAVTGVLTTIVRMEKAAAAAAATTVTTAATREFEVAAFTRRPTVEEEIVITAIKSAATQFTRMTSATTAAARRVSTTAATAQRTTNSKANKIMSNLLTTTTRAVPWWPILHGDDLLSSTNVMAKCRVTSHCACEIATNNDTATTAITVAALTSIFAEPSSAIIKSTASAAAAATPTSSTTAAILTAKVAATQAETNNAIAAATTTTTTAAAAKSNQPSWSAAHVSGHDGAQLSATRENNATLAFHAYNNNNNNTRRLATTVATSATNSTTAAAATTRTTTTLALASTTTTSKGTKSTSALQSRWQRILSRRKRYLAFPEGSSFTVSICITIGIVGNPVYNFMSFGLNWGVAYDLPNATWVLNQLHGLTRRPKPMAVVHRRSKRALYERIGEAVENMGYNGRECVLRALCESRQYFARHKMGMIGEMLRAIFSLPKQRLFTRELRENSDIGVYDHAYRKARSVDCAIHYDCSFSLLELAFGRYAKPSKDFYDKFGM